MVTNFMIMWWKNLLAVWEVALHFVCKFVKFCTFWQDHRRMGTKLGWEGAGAGGNLFVWKNGACPNAWELKSGWKRTQIAWKTESFTKIFILKACMLIDVYQETQSNNICNLWREIATEKFFLSWHSFSDQLRQKKTFQRNIQEKWKQSIVRTFQMPLFELPEKQKSRSSFVYFMSLFCWWNWERKQYPYCGFSWYTFNWFVANRKSEVSQLSLPELWTFCQKKRNFCSCGWRGGGAAAPTPAYTPMSKVWFQICYRGKFEPRKIHHMDKICLQLATFEFWGVCNSCAANFSQDMFIIMWSFIFNPWLKPTECETAWRKAVSTDVWDQY